MEFLKKTWKFFLGVVVTILGTLLIFRKDDSGELIDKSTRAGNNALDKVIKSNATRKEKTAAAAENHELEVEKIRKIFSKDYQPYQIGFITKEKLKIRTFGKLQW